MPITVKERFKTMERIRSELKSLIGKRMRIKANKGRKVIVEREGEIEKLYPNIFVVKVYENGDRIRRVSYNFADVLTKTVRFCTIEEDDDYFPWLSE
ncbi:hypothetical protein ES702_00629 [subsurface metagenome]